MRAAPRKSRFVTPRTENSDDEIVERALRIIALAPGIPHNAIQVKVQGGRITLTDVVTWNSQRLAAEAVMRKLTGTH